MDAQCISWDVEIINLDEPRYQHSAQHACQLYWQDWLAQFPPAQAAEIDQTLRLLALQRANGNFLYLSKLCQWIGKDKGPVDSWPNRLHDLPSDLLELQQRRWEQEGYTPAQRQHVLDGLCLLAAAYEPLPVYVINDVLGIDTSSAIWGDSPDASFWLLRGTNSDQVADGPGGGDLTMRLFHPVVGDFLRRQLGQEAAIKAAHRKLALAILSKWNSDGGGFWRIYGLRFAAAHLLEAGSPRSAVELVGSPEFLAAQVAQGLGGSGLLETLQRAKAAASTKDQINALSQLVEAVQAEVRFLQVEPACLLERVAFRLSAMKSMQPGLVLSLLRPPMAGIRLRRIHGQLMENSACPTLGRHPKQCAVLGFGVLPTQQVVSVNGFGEPLVFALDPKTPTQAWPEAINQPFAVAASEGELLLFSHVGDGCSYSLLPSEAGQPPCQLPIPLGGTVDDSLAVVTPFPATLLTVSELGRVALIPRSTQRGQPLSLDTGPIAAAWREDAEGREILGLDPNGAPILWRLPKPPFESTGDSDGRLHPCPRSPMNGWVVVGLNARDGLLSVLALGSDAPPSLVAQCTAHAGNRVCCCTFTADGQSALTGDESGRVVVWDLASGVPRQQMQDCSRLGVTAVTWIEDRRLAVLGFEDGTVKQWSPERTMASAQAENPPSLALTAILGQVEGGRILVQAGDEFYLCRTFEHAMQKLAMDPRIIDPIDVVPVAAGREIIIWTFDAVWRCNLDGRVLGPPVPHDQDERLLACFPDGKRLVVMTVEATVCILHLEDERRVVLADLFAIAPGLLAAVSPDGSRVACVLPEQLGIWDAESGRRLASLPAPPDPQQMQIVRSDSGLKVLLVTERVIQIYDLNGDDPEPQPIYPFADSLPGPLSIGSVSLLRDDSIVLLNSGKGPNWLRILRAGTPPPADLVSVLFEFQGDRGLVISETSDAETEITVLDRNYQLCVLRLRGPLSPPSERQMSVRMVATEKDEGEPWAQSLREQFQTQEPPLKVLANEAGEVETELPADVDVVVLMLSASAMSNATWKSLADSALERQAQGRCLVVPVRARPVGSLDTDYGVLEIVPLSKRALSQIPPDEIDEVCSQIAVYIHDRIAGRPLWQGATLELRLGSSMKIGTKA